MQQAPWKEREVDGDVVDGIAAMGYAPVLARILATRGLLSADLEEFFDPSLARLANPADLPGISKAVSIILPFIRERRKIVVFGDYDADGVCATAILVRAIRTLGGAAEAFIPGRFTEGYGMTEASLGRLLAEHPDAALVVTVDNGITSPSEVAALKARGMAVVVTDHHLPGPDIPVADALVNPHVASAPGFDGLCGAGVAFFLAAALAKEATACGLYSGGKFSGPLLVLAGLATVVDLVPLSGQSRILVKQALGAFNICAPIGLKELFLHASRREATLTQRDFGFVLGPRINAAGRMDSAAKALELLVTDDREVARQIAVDVDVLNVMRKTEEARMDQAVREQVGSFDGLPAVVAHGEDWHPGVAGIVASRVMESAHVPVAIAVGDHGSVRAPCGYDVHVALEASASALVRFGGHSSAGGFTLRPGAYEDFRRLFSDACAAQRASTPDAAAIMFDGWLEPSELTLDLLDGIAGLAPFGEGNPEPLFGVRNVSFSDVRIMGADGRHAAFTFVNRSIPRAVWWNHGNDAEELRAHSSARFDVLATLHQSEYGGLGRSLELWLAAVRPHMGQ